MKNCVVNEIHSKSTALIGNEAGAGADIRRERRLPLQKNVTERSTGRCKAALHNGIPAFLD